MNEDSLIYGLLLVLLPLQHHAINHLKINTSPSLCCRHTKCAVDRGRVLTNTKKSNKIYCTASSSTQISKDISKMDHTISTASSKILLPHIS